MYRFTIIVILLISGWLLAVADADIQTASLQLEGSTEARTEDYRLGPGDVIYITVDSVDEITLQYTISETEYVVFPTLLEPLKAQEPTLEQLRLHLIKLLTEYMYKPRLILLYHICDMEFLCGTYAENNGNPWDRQNRLKPSKPPLDLDGLNNFDVLTFSTFRRSNVFDRSHSWEEVL